ncbi:MAG: hypothetical protein CM15mP55_0240 [Hyphomicrobiales bacterium]|nr:MAG: hypothetical protein CM15mP55_0240 [Hyphomicrobiales bacterium]
MAENFFSGKFFPSAFQCSPGSGGFSALFPMRPDGGFTRGQLFFACLALGINPSRPRLPKNWFCWGRIAPNPSFPPFAPLFPKTPFKFLLGSLGPRPQPSPYPPESGLLLKPSPFPPDRGDRPPA